MTERDIQGLFLVLQDKLPTFNEGVAPGERELANLLLVTALKLLESFFVDINRIADASEVVASYTSFLEHQRRQ